jgi:DNA-directed RNA polymerase specialized sigma24 family protein
MPDGEVTVSDSDIALMMAMKDQEGLRLFLQRYGGRMKAYLTKYYAHVLQEQERDEAFNWAIHNIWNCADRYDEGKGQLSSWCIRIVQNAAKSVLRREMSFCSKNREYDDGFDPADPSSENDKTAQFFGPDDPRWEHVLKAIDTLPALQKTIVQADLAADGTADAQRLAEIRGNSIGSIYVSRNKAHENLKKRVVELMRQSAGKRG